MILKLILMLDCKSSIFQFIKIFHLNLLTLYDQTWIWSQTRLLVTLAMPLFSRQAYIVRQWCSFSQLHYFPPHYLHCSLSMKAKTRLNMLCSVRLCQITNTRRLTDDDWAHCSFLALELFWSRTTLTDYIPFSTNPAKLVQDQRGKKPNTLHIQTFHLAELIDLLFPGGKSTEPKPLAH